MTPETDRTLDCTGLYCHEPVFRVRLELDNMKTGQTVKVLADDPAAEGHIKMLVKRLGHEMLEMKTDNDATAFTAISAIILAPTTALYLQRRPRKTQTKPMKKIIAPYSELITETTEPPPATTHTININTLDDLAKTAEILARPILHTQQGPQHTFYVIDDNTTYTHTTQATDKE